jgi:hypothetical protein
LGLHAWGRALLLQLPAMALLPAVRPRGACCLGLLCPYLGLHCRFRAQVLEAAKKFYASKPQMEVAQLKA